jgi:endonuclease-3 related protein
LKEFSILVVRRGGWGAFINRDLNEVRNDLIKIKGIGYETADTILLFAGNKLVLPVSRLARRVLSRVGVNLPASYVRAQQILEKLIPEDLGSYKLFHATLVSISKKYCRSKKPLCAECPLQTICGFPTRNLKT